MADEVGATFGEFVQGAGRLDDVDVVIKMARFVTWDYKGKIDKPALALKLDIEDGEGTAHEEYLSAGDLKFFVPSGDGKKALPVGQQDKLNINTNAAAFLISLVNTDTRGEMAAKLRVSQDISILDGLRVHVVQKAQPKRASITAIPGQENVSKTQLQVERVISYPWEAAGAVAVKAASAAAPAAGATAAPAAAAAPAASLGSEETMGTAAGILLQVVSEAGGSIKKVAVAGKVFSNTDVKAMVQADKNAVLGLVTKDEFLNSELVKSMGMSFKDGIISLG